MIGFRRNVRGQTRSFRGVTQSVYIEVMVEERGGSTVRQTSRVPMTEAEATAII